MNVSDKFATRRPSFRWILGIGVLTPLLVVGIIFPPPELHKGTIHAVTGLVSHIMCSGVFVSGLAEEKVYVETLSPMTSVRRISWGLAYSVDTDHRSVTTRFLGRFERRANFQSGRGCTLEPVASMHEKLQTAVPPARTLPPVSIGNTPAIAGDSSALKDNFQAVLRSQFAREQQSHVNATSAIVVIHHGRIVAEQYASGYGPDTPLLGWSAAKSLVNALIGALVLEQKLSIHERAPVSEWRDPSDPRHDITIDHLLRMTSGLDIGKRWDRDAASRLLMLEDDMGGYAARAALKAPPGSLWQYENGNTMILSRIIRDAVGGSAFDVISYARRALFDPLHLQSVTIEFDSYDTPVGSTFIYASARDWARFGTLYLNDGIVDGKRLLPEGWVRYSSTRTLESNYAAGFRLQSDAWRQRWQLADDTFMATGLLGQYVLIAPSKQLVVARFGNSHTPNRDLEDFGQLIFDLLRLAQ